MSTVEEADQALLRSCGITDLDALAQGCVAARRSLGMPVTRWSARCLMVVIRLAVTVKGWPADGVKDALLTVARDPQTRSPARVAEAGPWWDAAVLGADLRVDARELADLEWRLSETGGLRPLVQAQARRELAAEGLPVTRRTVAQRACSILDHRTDSPACAAPESQPSFLEPPHPLDLGDSRNDPHPPDQHRADPHPRQHGRGASPTPSRTRRPEHPWGSRSRSPTSSATSSGGC